MNRDGSSCNDDGRIFIVCKAEEERHCARIAYIESFGLEDALARANSPVTMRQLD